MAEPSARDREVARSITDCSPNPTCWTHPEEGPVVCRRHHAIAAALAQARAEQREADARIAESAPCLRQLAEDQFCSMDAWDMKLAIAARIRGATP